MRLWGMKQRCWVSVEKEAKTSHPIEWALLGERGSGPWRPWSGLEVGETTLGTDGEDPHYMTGPWDGEHGRHSESCCALHDGKWAFRERALAEGIFWLLELGSGACSPCSPCSPLQSNPIETKAQRTDGHGEFLQTAPHSDWHLRVAGLWSNT